MEYYKLLQLSREPFSNSPDPEYFFNSRQHMGCLQKLELALRLKRGLNVVIGDVGTGKTTLCRQLIRNFSSEPDIETHLILDPSFDSSAEFLHTILEMVCIRSDSKDLSKSEMKEIIKRTLFQKGVDEAKIVVLIIDEGQKITEPCLEILRELLNYETNTHKLLQIVIFAQLEFNDVLKRHANFADRVNLLHYLTPLSFSDTRQLIQHRLKLSSTSAKPSRLFTLPAFWAIYRASRGYPRKIIHLCHQSVLALIIQNRTKAGWKLIQSCKNRIGPNSPLFMRKILFAIIFSAIAALLLILKPPVFKAIERQAPQSLSYKIESAVDKKESAAVNSISNEIKTPPVGAASVPAEPAHDNPTPSSAQISSQAEAQPMGEVAHLKESSLHSPEQIQPDAPAQISPAPEPEPPELLGQLIVQPGDTLSALAYQVYGTSNNRFLRALIEANPHIQDPNNIDIGIVIYFPSLPFKFDTPTKPYFVVLFEEHLSLPMAMKRFHTISAILKSDTQLVICRIPSQDLRFQIVQKNYFSSREAAQSHLGMLPFSIAAHAAIFPGWPKATIFYSAPFTVHKQVSL